MDLVPPLVVATVNVVAVHDRRQDELGLGLILTPLVFCNVLVVAVHAKRQEELGLRVHLDFDMDLLLCYETRRAWAWRSLGLGLAVHDMRHEELGLGVPLVRCLRLARLRRTIRHLQYIQNTFLYFTRLKE